MPKKAISTADDLPGIPTPEQKADYKERMAIIEALHAPSSWALPYFPLVEANVLRNSTHIEPAAPKKHPGRTFATAPRR